MPSRSRSSQASAGMAGVGLALEGHQPGWSIAQPQRGEQNSAPPPPPPKQRCWEASAWTELRGPDLGPAAQDTARFDLHSSPPVKREATGPVQELSASAVVLSRSLPVPSLAGPSQAMLAWRMEDEGRIIKAIITGRDWGHGDSLLQLGPCQGFLPAPVRAHPFSVAGAASSLAQDQLSVSAWIPTVVLSLADYKPQSSPGALPDLPAYILFLCFRHADHCRDEPRARSLLDAAINAIKRVMKVLGLGAWVGLRSRSFTGQGGGGTGAAAWPQNTACP